MNQIVGTCSICGGPVSASTHHIRPVPTCESCGATPREAYGPVIDMRESDAPDGGHRESQQEYFGINRRKR